MNIKIETIFERDIDFLIIEEFVADSAFANIFLGAVGINGDYTLEQVIHSKTDAEYGESDIVFILNLNGKHYALHVEDKINANAMPNQYGRYLERIRKDIDAGEYDAASVLLVAPEKYLNVNSEAQKYDNSVSYEQLRDYFAYKDDARARYKLSLIEKAIYWQKNGYQYEADPKMVEFCNKMNEYHKKKYPDLPLGSIAWWRYYPTYLKDVIIVFKADRGFCDLQFSHTTREELLLKVNEFKTNRMDIVQTGKSASVRITVSSISYADVFEDKIHEVDEALDAIYELLCLSKELSLL